jgi:holliday junction DNA helicase RuvA
VIGLIRGLLQEKQPPQLLVEVQGLGYEIDAPLSTCEQLPEIGENVQLYTHFVVREDAQQLFGFLTREERQLFRTLLKVNGIGPRVALSILSSATPDAFVRSVLQNDTASLIALPGIGKKTAERLVIEMRDKLTDWQPMQKSPLTTLENTPLARHRILQDAISALIALGYKQQEANRLVTKVDQGSESSEELIRRALREMM